MGSSEVEQLVLTSVEPLNVAPEDEGSLVEPSAREEQRPISKEDDTTLAASREQAPFVADATTSPREADINNAGVESDELSPVVGAPEKIDAPNILLSNNTLQERSSSSEITIPMVRVFSRFLSAIPLACPSSVKKVFSFLFYGKHHFLSPVPQGEGTLAS